MVISGKFIPHCESVFAYAFFLVLLLKKLLLLGLHLGSFPLPCLSSMNVFDSDSFANLARAGEILILFSNVLAIPRI